MNEVIDKADKRDLGKIFSYLELLEFIRKKSLTSS
jgi:hypothetical protein